MSVYDHPCEVCGMPTGHACVEIGTERPTLRDKPHIRRRPPDYGPTPIPDALRDQLLRQLERMSDHGGGGVRPEPDCKTGQCDQCECWRLACWLRQVTV